MPTGRKPKPEGEAVNRNPKRYEYQHPEGEGWQHGEVPAPPEGLDPETVEAWGLWFAAWWAAFWTPADLPALRSIIKEFDQVVKGRLDLSKISTSLDRYGITPKGRTDLRWAPPKPKATPAKPTARSRAKLRVVDKPA